MQFGEVVRRAAFNALDAMKGGVQKKIKTANKEALVKGITPAYEEERLRAILDYARKNSAFYREHASGPDLTDFPVMTKVRFNENRETVLADPYRGRERELFRLSTSGSTGAPFTVLCDGDKMNRVNMNFMSVMELNGFRLGMKRGEFRVWIEGKNKRSPWVLFKTNLVMIDISNMGDEALKGICETIRAKRIQVLVAYSSALTALADYLERTGTDRSGWDVEMIFAMGEALPDATYEKIRSLFGFTAVRSYGNNENGFMACQIGGEDGYTCDLYNFYFEMLKLDSDEPAEEGELGRIVVTDYYNRAFPMIRYDTGDTGIYRKTVGPDGRIRGTFEEIYGRRGSLMYNTKGEPLSIHVFMNVLINLEDTVRQAKCIQWEKDRYELLLNADRGRIDEEGVVGLYRGFLGEDAKITVTYVDEIPVEASGKRLVCENRCPDYSAGNGTVGIRR